MHQRNERSFITRMSVHFGRNTHPDRIASSRPAQKRPWQVPATQGVAPDELGYLPIDKTGADLLFQIISQRYENGSTIITTNRVFKKWPEIFNNDSTLTSAVLDRLLHHAETVKIEGRSFRMKDKIDST